MGSFYKCLYKALHFMFWNWCLEEIEWKQNKVSIENISLQISLI